MKIFDFTNNQKGDLLAQVKIVNCLGGFLVSKNGKRFKIEPAQVNRFGGELRWAEEADNGFGDLKPETFGVDAILFCTGEVFTKWHPGHPDAQSHFEWVIIGTTAWNREACKKGWLVATRT